MQATLCEHCGNVVPQCWRPTLGHCSGNISLQRCTNIGPQCHTNVNPQCCTNVGPQRYTNIDSQCPDVVPTVIAYVVPILYLGLE